MVLIIVLFGPASKKTYAAMAGFMGDGMVDIVGSRSQGRKWIHKSTKSIIGSLANAATCFISLIIKFAQYNGLTSDAIELRSNDYH